MTYPTTEQIANSVYASWACGHFDSLYHMLDGMRNAAIHWYVYDGDNAEYDRVMDDLSTLWEVALERRFD